MHFTELSSVIILLLVCSTNNPDKERDAVAGERIKQPSFARRNCVEFGETFAKLTVECQQMQTVITDVDGLLKTL